MASKYLVTAAEDDELLQVMLLPKDHRQKLEDVWHNLVRERDSSSDDPSGRPAPWSD